MPEGLLTRARKFIGLDGGEILEEATSPETRQQLDVTQALKGNRKTASGTSDYEIVVYEPRVYEDSLPISLELRKGNPVVINLKNLGNSEGTRLIDFVCGTAYAIDGHMIKIGDSIFLFTPSKILISDMEERKSLEESMQQP